MRHPLKQQAIARPDATFIDGWNEELTYRAAVDQARLWAATYEEAGVGQGARIALLGDNSVAWVEAALGAWLLGATLVPLNTRLTDETLVSQLHSIDVDLLVALGDHAEFALGPWPRCSRPTSFSMAREVDWEIDSVATIFFTSGTTGQPKPVPHTWRQLAASAAASAFNLGVVPNERWLCVLPLFHIGGLSTVLRSMFYGTTVVLHDSFSLERTFHALRHDTTLVSLVPTMLHRLLRDERADEMVRFNLRGVLLGGGPASLELLEQAMERRLPVFQTYGMTEAASQIATMPPSAAHDRVGSAGLPIFGADLSVRDDDETPLAPNETGNIWAKGPMITSGYLDRPEANERLFRDGWFNTGDFGYLDDDGYLWVESRRDDLIVSGGENVYPAEVEAVLRECPGVEDVAVVGETDAEWGQRVVGFVVGSVSVDELDTWARERLGGHQRPRGWHPIDRLPRTASGKVRRSALRENLG